MPDLPGVYVVFDGPPGPVSGRFIETENERGEGVGGIGWRKDERDYWLLGPFSETTVPYVELARAVMEEWGFNWKHQPAVRRILGPEMFDRLLAEAEVSHGG